MKHLISATLLLGTAMAFGLTSCSNGDDLPDVDLKVEYSGATNYHGVLYVVEGETLSIDAIKCETLEATKKATIGATAYYWDYQYLGTTIVEPFGLKVNTEGINPGQYLLEIKTTVYQEGKTAGIAFMQFPIMIVGSVDELPEGVIPDEGGVLNPDSDVRAGTIPTV